MSLGTLFLAAQLADLLWPTLLLLGVERVRIAPGLLAALPFGFKYYPFSHSLLAQLLLGLALGLGYGLLRRNWRGARLVGLLVLAVRGPRVLGRCQPGSGCCLRRAARRKYEPPLELGGRTFV